MVEQTPAAIGEGRLAAASLAKNQDYDQVQDDASPPRVRVFGSGPRRRFEQAWHTIK